MASVVCAILQKGSRFLVAKRPLHKKNALKWEFPGGKVEHGETQQEALAREIKEELSIDVLPIESIATVAIGGSSSLTLTAWLCRWTRGDIQLTEHLEFRWADIDELNELSLSEADQALMPSIVCYFADKH